MLKQLKFAAIGLLAGVALAAAYGAVGPGKHAFALHGADIISTGTFTSSGAQLGNSIPDGMTKATELETMLDGMLYGNAEYGRPGSNYNKYGAAFLIETMLHGQVNYSESAAFLTQARDDYPTWARYVDEYSAAGRITWNLATTVPAGSINSTHVCNDPNGYCWDEAVYYNNNFNGGGTDAHRYQFYNMSASEASNLIIFRNADGTTFQIRRQCANVIGSAHPLKELGWKLTGQTTANVSSVYAGDTATFTSQIKNTGGGYAVNFDWYVRYCYDSCSSGYTQYTSGTEPSLSNSGGWKTENVWDFTLPLSTTHTRVCVWISYSDANGPGTAEGNGSQACVNIVPLVSSCGGVAVNPTLIGTNDSYTVTGTVNTNDGKAGAQTISDNSNFFIRVSGPSVNINNTNVTPVTVGGSSSSAGQGTLVASINPSATNDQGSYTVTYGITGSVAPVSCSGSFSVTDRPYFSALGGDVAAGSGFGGSCTEPTAGIKSWNLNTSSTPNYYGAGTETGAWATGLISNFVSGMGLTGGAASGNGYGLSFSNTSNTGGGGYGGNFGANAVPCMYNYYGNKPTSGVSNLPGSTVSSLAAVSTGSYNGPLDGSGTFTLGGSGDMTLGPDASGAGRQITIYVNGNLYIKNNIKYSYSSLYQIPRLNLYVKGSIYIDPSVTELHGVYVAQKSGAAGGYITTCSPGVTSAPQSYATCNKQLKFVGAVAAENGMRLNRTYGNITTTSGATNQPAEVFQYSPELWMAAPTDSGFQYQAYTSLPPVL